MYEAYTLWDQLLAHTNSSQFSAALADLTALWQAIGTTFNSGDPLYVALQQGNRTTAINLENTMAIRFRRPCDRSVASATKLHLLRVGADGSSTDVVVKEWRQSSTSTFSLSANHPGYLITEIETGPSFIDIDSAPPITDADTGALFSWRATESCYADLETVGRSYHHVGTCRTEPEDHLTRTSGGRITSDVVWAPDADATGAVRPILQLEDGSYAGVSSSFAANTLVAFDIAGTVKWTAPGYAPRFATSGGGLIADGPVGRYTFDADGNSTGAVSNPPQAYSWTGEGYNLGSVEQVVAHWFTLAPTFAAIADGNASENGTAIKQTYETAHSNEEQLPPPDATLHFNYNSIHLSTDLTAHQIFEQYLQTFAGVKENTNSVAYVSSATPVTTPRQTVSFILKKPNPVLKGFKVGVAQADGASNTISVVTLKGHPLAGWRYFRSFDVAPTEVVVETGPWMLRRLEPS